MARGKFITVEGIEGVGKSTNLAVLVETIKDAGFEVVATREPGGTPLAEDIRDLLMHRADEPIPPIAEVLMMFSARALNVENVIKPALAAGKWVVCDRFTDSTHAYQAGGRGVTEDVVDTLARWVHDTTRPDLTLLLDAPVEVGRARAESRGDPDRFERERGAFFTRVRERYLSLAKREPQRIRIIDTSAELERVTAAVREEVSRFIVDFSH